MNVSRDSNPARPSGFGKPLARLACAASLALSGMLPATVVHATDGKVYSGSSCQYIYANAVNSAIYTTWQALLNYTDHNIEVICPGVRDQGYGLTSAVVYVYKPASTAAVTCYLNSLSKDGLNSLFAVRSNTSTSAGTKILSFGALGGLAGPYTLQCFLPPYARLNSYQLNEVE